MLKNFTRSFKNKQLYTRSRLMFIVIMLFSFIIINGQNKPVAGSGNAILLDGVNDYVNGGSGVNLKNKSFTIEFWAKRDTVLAFVTDIVISQHEEWAKNKSLAFGFHGDVAMFSFMTDECYSDFGSAKENTWNHWAATYDIDNNEMAIFKNGDKIASHIRKSGPLQASGDIIIGHDGRGLSNFFEGTLDEIRIWEYARTTEEIYNNYNKLIKGNKEGLLLYYKCDNNTDKLVDATGNNNTGVLHNFEQNRVISTLYSDISVTKGQSARIPAGYDPTNNTLLISVEVAPEKGTVQIDSLNHEIIYTSRDYAFGNDIFQYKISNGIEEVIQDVAVSIPNTGPIAGGAGMAVGFNGIDDGGTAYFSHAKTNTDFTLEFWAKRDRKDIREVIYGRGYQNQIMFQLGFSNSNQFFIQFLNETLILEDKIADSLWHHYAIVYSYQKNKTLSVLVDGEEVLTKENFAQETLFEGEGFVLGFEYVPANGYLPFINFFKGQLDELRIWYKEVSIDELRANMYKEMKGNEKNLKGYWNFNTHVEVPFGFLFSNIKGPGDQNVELQKYTNEPNPGKPQLIPVSDVWQNRQVMQNGFCKTSVNSDDEDVFATILKEPSNGFTKVNNNGDVYYFPKSNFNEKESFTYVVSDGTSKDSVTIFTTIDTGEQVKAQITAVSSTEFTLSLEKPVILFSQNIALEGQGEVLSVESANNGLDHTIKTTPLDNTANKFRINKSGYVIDIANPVNLKQSPEISADETNNDIFNDITLITGDDANWRNDITGISVNGNIYSNFAYAVGTTSITMKSILFQKAGIYNINVITSGYTSPTIEQPIVLLNPVNIKADTNNNNLDSDVFLTFASSENWVSEIKKITVNGNSIASSDYTLSSTSIELKNWVFLKDGVHNINIIAKGYADATVQQTILKGTVNWNNKIISTYLKDNFVNAPATDELIINFENAVSLEDGYIEVCMYTGQLLERIHVLSDQVSGNNTNKLTIKMSKQLMNYSYYILVDKGAFGKGYKGISDAYTWNFSKNEKLTEIHYSQAINDKMKIEIYLPDGYNLYNDIEYPVVYLTDGYWRNGVINKLRTSMAKGNIKESIIVSVGYNPSVRDRDLTYGNHNFYNYFEEELIPYIDAHFETDPNDRTMIGHSYGGLFSLYCLFQSYNSEEPLFHKYIAASPSLWWPGNYQAMFNAEKEMAASIDSLPVELYITIGGREGDGMILPYYDMVDSLTLRGYAGFEMHDEFISYANHGGTVSPSITDGMEWFAQDEFFITFSILDIIYINDEPVELTTGRPEGGTYSGPGVNDNILDPSIAGLGTHAISYTITNGTDTLIRTQYITITERPTSITKLSNPEIKIMPNPATDYVMVSTGNNVFSPVTVNIISLSGNVVRSQLINSQSNTIDIGDIETGIYIVHIQGGSINTTKKLVINR